MALILGIESTCDETAAAVVADGYDVRSNVVATQVDLHAKYRGVVPEIASRAHIENILPVVREAAGGNDEFGTMNDEQNAGTPAPVHHSSFLLHRFPPDAIAVAHRPG